MTFVKVAYGVINCIASDLDYVLLLHTEGQQTANLH